MLKLWLYEYDLSEKRKHTKRPFTDDKSASRHFFVSSRHA